jgi:lipooligosaccharide transport system ATP-binding protein
MDKTVVVRARGLTKHYGPVAAVDGVDFEVCAGECFGMLGPNGAGKTSIMRMLYDISPRTSGELAVFGLDPAREGIRLRQTLGVVPQTDNLDLELTVRENLVVYGCYYGMRDGALRRRVDELLAFMSLENRADARIKQLSGGMKRRLTIVRALINSPRLMILDEPTTGLDPQVRHQIWDALRELTAGGMTIVLTTHYMDEAERLCDRLVIMDRGRILTGGTPRALIAENLPRLVLEVDRSDLAEGWERTAVRFELRGDRVFFLADEEAAFSGIDFRDTRVRRFLRPANLEDLFLKLTGKVLQDDQA